MHPIIFFHKVLVIQLHIVDVRLEQVFHRDPKIVRIYSPVNFVTSTNHANTNKSVDTKLRYTSEH